MLISRRRFLAGLSLAATAPHFLARSARALPGGGDDRVLVVLQLSGGNDGLSMVVPFGDPAYYRARRTIAIPEKDVLRLDDHVGLHPALAGCHRIFGEGGLAVVQGAGYPNPNRSHFAAMDIWHTADPRGRRLPTGWLGRAVDACCAESSEPALAINLGETLPYALEAEVHKAVAFDSPERYAWTGAPADRGDFDRLNEAAAAEGEVGWLHRVAVDARASSDGIQAAARAYRPAVEYPRGQPAGDLRTVAALVAGGLPTRVFYVSFGGFDTHNGQRGRHDSLMRQLDAALDAFARDLAAQGLGRRVLLLAFSEFGRRVAENGSAGTDHGVAGPMLLLGEPVRGGLHGRHPSLTDLDRGDLKMTVDFRAVYGTVLAHWLGVLQERVLGRDYGTLPLL